MDNVNKVKFGEYSKRLKDFLNSDTTEAKIATVALCVFAVASLPVLVLGASAMGNAVQMFKMFEGSKKYSRRQISSAIDHIKKQNLIEYITDKKGKTMVSITNKGQTRLRDFSIDLIKIKKPNRWDGKWRLVMFDIPMRFTKAREALRYHLKKLGFLQFQKSAWIYPYPCEDEIVFIGDFFGVGRHIEILTIENFSDDKKLREHFNL